MTVTCDTGSEEMLKRYITTFEGALQSDLKSLSCPQKLIDASLYSLCTGGKRIRPLLVYSMSEAAGNDLPIIEAALSVEYFHTASIIADDLPLMDDDDMRRGLPTLHKKFDQATALLTSYGLICRAFRMIHKAGVSYERESGNPSSERIAIALKIAGNASGFEGATGGQYLDLFEEVKNLENYLEISQKKTASLFEVSFCFGWIFGGGELNELQRISKMARDFGFVFQLIDDYADMKQDEKLNPTKNLFHLLTHDQATKLLQKVWDRYQTQSEELREKSPMLSHLSEKLLKAFPEGLLALQS